mmetsp:Transcript_21778/g.40657  ORF Transcript_21778/g.40657 Transcript_21778/m.40657 type:complete len:109 (-) Transcript_21778:212-538(-)
MKEYVPEIKPAESPEYALEVFWNQLKMKLASSPKSSGDKVLDAAKIVWDLLKDGNAYHPDELVEPTSYGMVRSTGFGEILKAMKQLGFTHRVDGNLAFTDKVFSFRRP